MIVESVAGDYCGRLRSHRFVRSDRQRHARLHFDRHRAETLERHARKPAQTHCTVALAAGSTGEVARSWRRRIPRVVPSLLPLECCEPGRWRHHAVLYCGCRVAGVIPDVVVYKSLHCALSVFLCRFFVLNVWRICYCHCHLYCYKSFSDSCVIEVRTTAHCYFDDWCKLIQQLLSYSQLLEG